MKKTFIHAFAEIVVEKRLLVLMISAVLLVLSVVPLKNLYFENNYEIWFMKDDPTIMTYQKLRDLFGSSQYQLIGVEAQDNEKTVITKKNLNAIHKITEFLEDHEFVTKVASLSKYQHMKSENDILKIEDLIEDFDDFQGSAGEIDRIEDIMKNEEMAIGALITRDLRHTMIVARQVFKKDTADHKIKLVNDLKDFLEKERFEEKGIRLHWGGDAYMAERFSSTSEKDSKTTTPLMLLFLLVFLLLSFRRFSGIILPFVVIISSILVSFGFMGVIGWSFNMINFSLATLIMTIGIGDSVHILVRFFQQLDNGMTAKYAAKDSIETLFLPCFYTSLTTAIGFLAITSTKLIPLKEFGYLASIGVFMAFIFSVTTLPALTSFLRPKKNKTNKKTQAGLVVKLVGRITNFTFTYNKTIVLVSLIAVIFSIGVIKDLKFDANPSSYFKKSDPVRQDIDYFNRIFDGGFNLEIIVDSQKEGGVKDPVFLNRVLQLQNYIESLKNVGKSDSILNYIRRIYEVMNNNDPDFYRIPETRELVAQLLLMYSNSGPDEDFSDMVSFDYRYMRLSVRHATVSNSELRKTIEQVENKIQLDFPDLSISLTGDLVLFDNMNTYIKQGLVSSFLIAIAVIGLCFFVLFRSFKYSILAIIPSLTPIIITGGIMGILGIDVDIMTMIVAAVTFGIAVDDTVHMMTRYMLSRKNGKTRKESVNAALTESGRAIVYTSFILFFGFSVLILSSFVPNIFFGFLAGLVIVSALIANLILLPAVIFLTGDKKAYSVRESQQVLSNN